MLLAKEAQTVEGGRKLSNTVLIGIEDNNILLLEKSIRETPIQPTI
jgi:hypothetical protein